MTTGDPVCLIHGMTPCKCESRRDKYPEEFAGPIVKNDLATLERAVVYCRGQSMFDPAENPEYDKGVAACVSMLEDMMPYPSEANDTPRTEALAADLIDADRLSVAGALWSWARTLERELANASHNAKLYADRCCALGRENVVMRNALEVASNSSRFHCDHPAAAAIVDAALAYPLHPKRTEP